MLCGVVWCCVVLFRASIFDRGVVYPNMSRKARPHDLMNNSFVQGGRAKGNRIVRVPHTPKDCYYYHILLEEYIGALCMCSRAALEQDMGIQQTSKVESHL